MKTILKSVVCLFPAFILFCNTLSANVSLPSVFGDHMVLQQKSEMKIWGWAKTGEKVTIKADWMKEELSVVADNQGTWSIPFSTPSAGGPHTMTVTGYNRIEFSNVLIGEVWLCSGQSNMEWSARSGIINGEEEIKNADFPSIRLFSVYHCTSEYPQEKLTGQWSVCTPETMQGFSVVAYFFARKLSRELGIPVGLINSSWGGTPAEAWMPGEVISGDPVLKEAASRQKPVPWGPVEPGRIYNAMIHPIIPFKIAGVLWYQGEANTLNADAYTALLSALIGSWRDKWKDNFPFYFAQIAPYRYGRPFEGAKVREAQRRTLKVPGTGMIILSDIGDTTNIHPRNKQDVGLRFASMALNRHYKTIQTEDSGPLFRDLSIDKNKIIVSFDHGEGLNARGEKPTCFEIAGADQVFYPAEAKIKDNMVILQSAAVKEPVSARFAWGNTSTPNLINGAGLPASCFNSQW
jgi:sialate O-acetylesterase